MDRRDVWVRFAVGFAAQGCRPDDAAARADALMSAYDERFSAKVGESPTQKKTTPSANRRTSSQPDRFRWYLTATVVKQYATLRGKPSNGNDSAFWEAEEELAQRCWSARLVSQSEEHQSETWRCPGGGFGFRLELTVSTVPRPEGPLLPLVAIRRK